MNEKNNKKKQKYESIEIDVCIVDNVDVITISSPVSTSEHDNAYTLFGIYE